MEGSQPLATESFSLSWLVNSNPKIEPLEDSNEAMDGDTVSRRLHHQTQSFDFNVCVGDQSSNPLVHADKLFSNGLIMPVFIKPSNSTTETAAVSISNASSPMHSSPPSRDPSPRVWTHRFFLKKWRRYSGKILQKYFKLLMPSCRNRSGSRRNTRVDDLDTREREVKSLSSTPEQSPARSTPDYNPRGNWGDTDRSVYEAILYCKRSNGL
ncbi:hypothetical protein Ancab_037920 [Ancistrocladus abbreviatus]